MQSGFRSAAVICVLACSAASAGSQPVDPKRGQDPRVDYAALQDLAPWDDRNYQLTAEDLKLLAPNENEQRDPIPAFFRVELRKQYPELRRSGPAQYPRSALNVFRLLYRGYLIDGKLYTGVELVDGKLRVITSGPKARPVDPDLLTGEVCATCPPDSGDAESAVEVNPASTNVVIAGTNRGAGGQGMYRSTDGGQTWALAGALPGGATCCDPTVAWSSDGAKAYAATLGGCTSLCHVFFYRSADNGATWADLSGAPARRQLTSGAAQNDKEYLHVDTFAGSPFKDNLYMTWHKNNVMQFARSTDQGNIWSAVTAFAADPSGIGSDIATDKSGSVYYVYPAFSPSQTVRLLKSTNGGTSFGASTQIATTNGDFDWPIPSMEARRAWIYLAAGADLSNGPFADSIYAAWTDTSAAESGTAANNHTRIQVAYSRNGGSTWTVVTPHATGDINTVDRFNQWMAVAPNGRINLIYYNTVNSVSRTGVDVYHTFSVDGGQTWSPESRVTSVTSPNIADGFEWGDYNGLSTLASEAISIFTDNRLEAGGAGDSIDVYVAAPNPVPVKLDSFSIE